MTPTDYISPSPSWDLKNWEIPAKGCGVTLGGPSGHPVHRGLHDEGRNVTSTWEVPRARPGASVDLACDLP